MDLRHHAAPGAATTLLTGVRFADEHGNGVPGSGRAGPAAEPIPRPPVPAACGLWPVRAATRPRSGPVVVGYLRTDVRTACNRAMSRAVSDAEEPAVRAMAGRHQWRLVRMLRLQPGTDGITDPIAHLLTVSRMLAADTVVVPDLLHLRDMWGRDRLPAVRTVCPVATVSPERLWPATGPARPGHDAVTGPGTRPLRARCRPPRYGGDYAA